MKVLGMTAEDIAAEDDDIEDIIDDIGVLRKGSSGDGVKIMQEALGITADGAFGPGTERALKEWQAANGLTADGVAGPATFANYWRIKMSIDSLPTGLKESVQDCADQLNEQKH